LLLLHDQRQFGASRGKKFALRALLMLPTHYALDLSYNSALDLGANRAKVCCQVLFRAKMWIKHDMEMFAVEFTEVQYN
jgi:hypothetical protein